MFILNVRYKENEDYLVFQSEPSEPEALADGLIEMLDNIGDEYDDYHSCIDAYKDWCSDNYGIYPTWVDKDSVIEIVRK